MRQQTWGALIALAVALFYAFVLPPLGMAVEDDWDFTPGQPFEVGGGLTIVPAERWDLSSSGEILTTFSNGAATLAVLSAAPVSGSSSEIIDTAIESLESDETDQWVIGDTESYTTEAGYDVISVEAHSSASAQKVWVIDDGCSTTTLIAASPEDLWIGYADDFEDMAMSVRFRSEP